MTVGLRGEKVEIATACCRAGVFNPWPVRHVFVARKFFPKF